MEKVNEKDKKEKSVQLRKKTTETSKVQKPGKAKKASGKRPAVQGGRTVGRKHLKGDTGGVLRNVHAPTRADEVK